MCVKVVAAAACQECLTVGTMIECCAVAVAVAVSLRLYVSWCVHAPLFSALLLFAVYVRCSVQST